MMNVEAVSIPTTTQTQLSKGADDISVARKKSQDLTLVDSSEQNDVQPEELLQQIKALTEDGLYSVRFENNEDAGEMVVKVVDPKTDEVIRQIPAEELLNLTQRLKDLRGNIVDTEG